VRFLTQDTYKGNAWEPMSQNLYTYVGNNPIRYIDPTGHMREWSASAGGTDYDDSLAVPISGSSLEYVPE